MKILGCVLCVLALMAYSRAQGTTMDTGNTPTNVDTCNVKQNCVVETDCTSKYGAFKRSNVTEDAQKLIQDHFASSMIMLNLAASFGDVKVYRKGFSEYYEKLSDDLWEDGLRILGHFTKRGGQLNDLTITPVVGNANLKPNSEVNTLGLALTKEKELWSKTQNLIFEATHHKQPQEKLDAHFAHFLVDEVAEVHVNRIKELSNHVNTLIQLLAGKDEAGTRFALFIYDTEFLK